MSCVFDYGILFSILSWKIYWRSLTKAAPINKLSIQYSSKQGWLYCVLCRSAGEMPQRRLLLLVVNFLCLGSWNGPQSCKITNCGLYDLLLWPGCLHSLQPTTGKAEQPPHDSSSWADQEPMNLSSHMHHIALLATCHCSCSPGHRIRLRCYVGGLPHQARYKW